MADIIDLGCALETRYREEALTQCLNRPRPEAICEHCEENPAAHAHTGALTRYCARCAFEVLGVIL